MRIWGNKASVYLEGKWSAFIPYTEAVQLQAEHTVKQIEAALLRGKPILMSRDQAQHLDAVRAHRHMANRATGTEHYAWR
jgi:hypothetical protein